MKIGLRVVMIGLVSMLSLACGTKKNNAELNGFMAQGIVKVSAKPGDCALWISSSKAEGGTGFYPVNLEEQFKKDGLKVAFNFNPSRAPLPENCERLQAIVISEVKVLK